MKKIAFYHVHLTDDTSWSYIFLDQFREGLNSGLFDILDELYISANGNNDEIKKITGIVNYLQTLVKTRIITKLTFKENKDLEFFNHQNVITEDVTLKLLWDKCNEESENFHVLYFHTKGSTAIWRYLNEDRHSEFTNYYFWRKQIDWAVLEKYKECIKHLDNYDAVGTNISLWPLPHFAGSGWWSNSSFIKTLPNPAEDFWWHQASEIIPELKNIEKRVKAEMWLGIGNARFNSLYRDDNKVLPNILPSQVYYDRKEYTQTTKENYLRIAHKKPSAWEGHGRFAMHLVEKINPKIVVDLGVEYGYSTFCFAYHNIGTVYGIDWFQGDAHAGFNDDSFQTTFETYTELASKFGISNIKIVKGEFTEIAKTWDKTIDILHIDGLHTYEAVKHDFETWTRFCHNESIILFHDTVSYPYTVGRFFNEIGGGYKIDKLDSCGLGIFTKSEQKYNLVQEILKSS